MSNEYINLYKGNPTAGGTDGTVVSLSGDQTSPVEFSLDATSSESAVQTLALRCESGYVTSGDTSIYASGDTYSMWTFSLDGTTFSSTITITDTIDETNTVFYVTAASDSTESAGVDTTVSIVVDTTVTSST